MGVSPLQKACVGTWFSGHMMGRGTTGPQWVGVAKIRNIFKAQEYLKPKDTR